MLLPVKLVRLKLPSALALRSRILKGRFGRVECRALRRLDFSRVSSTKDHVCTVLMEKVEAPSKVEAPFEFVSNCPVSFIVAQSVEQGWPLGNLRATVIAL